MTVREVKIPIAVLRLMRLLMQGAENTFGGKTGTLKKAWVLTALREALERVPETQRPAWFPRNETTLEVRALKITEALDILGFALEIVWGLLFNKTWLTELPDFAE